MKQTFKINGMSCGSCKQTVEKALQEVTGVGSVQVSMSPDEVIIEKEDSVTLNQLNTALSKAGHYSIGDEEPSSNQKNKGSCCCG